jgi:molybdenum cofactor cytidylyltransferase
VIFAIFLASGHSKRFGTDKLTYEVDGVPMAERAFLSLPEGVRGVAVTRSGAVAAMARAHGLGAVMNPDETDDVAVTIRLGMEAVPADADGAMFFVCDQPHLTRESVARLCRSFEGRPDRIYVLSYEGRSGNPCIYPKDLFGELKNLPRNQPGKYVANRHKERVEAVQASSALELRDMDEK